MAANGYPSQNGVGGTNGVHTPNGTRQNVGRVLSVDDALPYSPFSSVVPFNSGMNDHTYRRLILIKDLDIIPSPSIGLHSSVSIYANEEERKKGRRDLDMLNREAKMQPTTSQKLQKTLNELKDLLKPESLPQL